MNENGERERERRYLTFLVGVLANPGNELLNLVIDFLLHFYFTTLYLVKSEIKKKKITHATIA